MIALVNRLLSLAAGTLAEFSPAETVGAAAAAGFPAVGIWFDPKTWSPVVAADVRRRLNDTGLVALDVEPVMVSADGDHGDALVEAAVELGARFVLVASLDDDHGRVANRLAQLADRLADASTKLVLEFLPSLGVRTMAEAVTIVSAVAKPQVGVLIDNLHLARSGGTPADVSAVDTQLFPYVQLCDALAEPVDPSRRGLLDEALHGRLLPATGALPIDEFLDVVPFVPISFEVRSAELRDRYPDATERARVVWAATTHWR